MPFTRLIVIDNYYMVEVLSSSITVKTLVFNMQNCYRKGRIPQHDSEAEEVEDQNGRLTTKHIHTLKFLQDVVNENKTLKARVEELEAELSKCAQLHTSAEETQQRIKQMKADFLRRTDEINQLLLERHKIEMMKKVEDNIDAEKKWDEERRKLLEEIENLKKIIARHTEDLNAALGSGEQLELLQEKCDSQRQEIEHLLVREQELTESTQNQLQEIQRYRTVEDDNSALTEELAYAEQTNQELRFQISKLEHNLGESGVNQQDELLAMLRAKLKKVHAERADALEQVVKCQAANDDLDAENSGLRRALSDSERMRSELKAHMDTLMQEMAALMRNKSSVEIDNHNFKDFVHVKRELANVNRENESLRQQLRPVRDGALPKLKGSGSLTSSSSSIRSGKKAASKNMSTALMRRW